MPTPTAATCSAGSASAGAAADAPRRLLALFGLIGITGQQAPRAAGAPLRLDRRPAAFVACAAADRDRRPRPRPDHAAGRDHRRQPRHAGRQARTITVGTARRGSPAQARVRDVHGQRFIT
jgi:hypothetical protein